MTNEWLGLTLVREVKANGKKKNIRTTDEWAITYAAKKFDVSESEIELVRDNTLIKVRPIQDEEIEFMSLEQFTYELYGFPEEVDEYYTTFKQFGYSNWLIKTYPEEWGIGAYDRMMFNLLCDYHWYRLEEYIGEELDALGAVLSDFLAGSYIVVPLAEFISELPLNFPCFELGILVWEEELEIFCLFLDDDGEFYPMSVKSELVEITDEIFEGFE